MSQMIRADDPRLTWQGAVSLELTDQWTMPWRMPHQDRALFPPDDFLGRLAMSAGVRIVFRSDTTTVAGEMEPCAEDTRLDLSCDGEIAGTADVAGRDRFRFDGLPAGQKLIEIWLPQYGEFRLRHLELSDGASVAQVHDNRPRWITYGSSITQCRDAASPAQTWPAIVARKRGLNLTCLGFGSHCHLDAMIARMIRDLPADFLSTCVGINICGSASLNARTFRPAIIGFVQIVREKHPETPFAVISPIYARHNEETPNAVGLMLSAMRGEVASAVAALQAHGDRNVHYVDGLALFGPELAGLLPEGVHPNAEGYKVLAANFLDQVVARVFP